MITGYLANLSQVDTNFFINHVLNPVQAPFISHVAPPIIFAPPNGMVTPDESSPSITFGSIR